jgi:hypothetical protein
VNVATAGGATGVTGRIETAMKMETKTVRALVPFRLASQCIGLFDLLDPVAEAVSKIQPYGTQSKRVALVARETSALMKRQPKVLDHAHLRDRAQRVSESVAEVKYGSMLPPTGASGVLSLSRVRFLYCIAPTDASST